MAAVLGSTKLGLKETGSSCTVPDNYTAKLMYYFNCMCSVLKLEDESAEISRLKNYQNYRQLSSDEIDKLVLVCAMLSPDVLLNKCIFQDDALCKDSSNKFYELSAVQNRFVVTNSIMIGGQQRAVHKIMTFKMSWLQNYWVEPMQHMKSRLQTRAAPRRESRCSVM